jgi:two-component system alkaline phosphatase synthesis response regulator PhoP
LGVHLLDTPSSILVFIVEDDRDIADLVAHHLKQAGCLTKIVSSGGDVLPEMRKNSPDLVVLDLMLPILNGLEICRMIRAEPRLADIPVIMLTANSEESDRIVGLEIGADDYVTKPFSPKELVARVRAVLRRGRHLQKYQKMLSFGKLIVDAERHVVTFDGSEIILTAKEFLLIKYLLEHRGRVLSRDILLSDVWGYSYTGGTRTVDVHIRRLREKLPFLSSSIVTVKQFGYKLVDSED